MNTQNYSPGVPIILPQMQKSFPSVLLKRFYQVPLRLHSGTSQRKSANHEKTSHENFQNEVRLLSLNVITWTQKIDVLSSQKGLQLVKVITPPVNNHLF